MILTHLARHIAARRSTYSLSSWLLCIVRSARVLAFYRDHRRLCALPLYREYVATAQNDDLFHHLSHRHYLAKHFSTRQRVRLALHHYGFEQRSFSSDYKRSVYLSPGLPLWQQDSFDLVLHMATRLNAEGDLTLALRAEGQPLHRISFSWASGEVAGLSCPVLPFIARNQGHGPESAAAFAAFNATFPHNAPVLFCLAGMQGIAQAVAASHLLGVSTEAQVASRHLPGKFFVNAYDRCWHGLGGTPLVSGLAHLIPVPFPLRPLEEVPARHRRRAAQRRAHWQAIADSARAAITAQRVSAGLP